MLDKGGSTRVIRFKNKHPLATLFPKPQIKVCANVDQKVKNFPPPIKSHLPTETRPGFYNWYYTLPKTAAIRGPNIFRPHTRVFKKKKSFKIKIS